VTHFALITVDGDTLGAVELERAEWPPGAIIDGDGDEPTLRVVDVIVNDDPETFDVLVVEPYEE
jgi:hypothetical protein